MFTIKAMVDLYKTDDLYSNPFTSIVLPIMEIHTAMGDLTNTIDLHFNPLNWVYSIPSSLTISDNKISSMLIDQIVLTLGETAIKSERESGGGSFAIRVCGYYCARCL